MSDTHNYRGLISNPLPLNQDDCVIARNLLSKHLHLQGCDGSSITDRNTFNACLDAIMEALRTTTSHNPNNLILGNAK